MIKNLGSAETYKLYIGMNDKDTLKQRCSSEDFINIVREVCEDYQIAFSMNETVGGYMMSSGTFITERSLVLTISGFNREQILALAESLRVILNQETIMVSLQTPEYYLVTEK